MSDINKMNISLLKSYHQDFSNEKENFNQSSFQTFSSSYLKNCSDPYVLKMNDSLNRIYLKIKNGYANIDNWWVDYNENLEGLENALSNDTKSGSISEGLLRNYVNTQLPELRNYNLKLAGIISPVVVGAVKSPKFINDKVVSSVDPFANLYREYDDDKSVDNFVSKINEYDGKVFEQVNSKVTTVKENVSSKVTEVVDMETTSFKQVGSYVADKAESMWDSATDWVSNAADTVGDFFSDVGTTISDGAKSLWADVTNWWDGVVDWWNEDALPWIENAANAVWDTLKRVGATIAVFVQSLVEGLLQFVEAIVDFVAIVGTGVASIFTGLYDGYQAIRGAITGEEWSSATVAMWEKGTMAFVSNQYVTGWFDALYQNTGYGNWLMDNAYGFDTVRSIGSGIGYIAGVVLLTVATFGAGSVVAAGGTVTASTAVAATTSTQMAIIATAAGVGKGTETAWSEGASLLEGLSVGTLTGLWEGFQFYIGGKIGMTSLFGKNGIFKAIGGSGIGTKILNGFARVVLDGVDGGLEGFVQPALQSIYKDGYYDENGQYVEFSNEYNILERYVELFNDSGGWKNVGIQATIGSASSLLGEVFDLNKYFKNSQGSSDLNNATATLKLDNDNVTAPLNSNSKLTSKQIRANAKSLKEFMMAMKTGEASNMSVVKLMHDTFEDAMNRQVPYAKEILDMFTFHKKNRPDMKLMNPLYGDRSYQLGGTIFMGKNAVAIGDSGTFCHELGHCLFYSVLFEEIPDNFDGILTRARAIASNNDMLRQWSKELSNVNSNATRISEFEYQDFLKAQGFTEKSYIERLTSGYDQLLKNNPIEEILSDMGYDEQTIKVIISGSPVTALDLAYMKVTMEKAQIKDNFCRKKLGAYGAISDMADAIFGGRNVDDNNIAFAKTYGHGEAYYQDNYHKFHELIANFTQLKLTENPIFLEKFRSIFGDEMYNILDETFNKFLKVNK